jgi:hypothetical protein
MGKIRRNEPCSCGSGKKYKKCCFLQKASVQSFSWEDNDGIHLVAPGSSPSPEELKKMTTEYQKQIRNSPLWDEMVKNYGEKEAKKLLKEFKAEAR